MASRRMIFLLAIGIAALLLLVPGLLIAPQEGSPWRLVWSDEFDGPAGEQPDAAHWTFEIGDGRSKGIPGWGNNELEFYTDSPANAAFDGAGNLVITALELDRSLAPTCYYGACRYSSARLITEKKVEQQYGRIEARIRLPVGQGLWPAFWMLGDNLADVGWPASGEIDIMEHVGKEPANLYGTIHGPGYSGANGISGKTTLPDGQLADDFHLYAVEWEEGQIRWFLDETNYFTATVDSLPAGSPWVFDHPFYLILNLAVGGNWPGRPDETTQFPQQMLVDYIRIYEAQEPETTYRLRLPFVRSAPGE